MNCPSLRSLSYFAATSLTVATISSVSVAADCPHGVAIDSSLTCTVPAGTGMVTVELWGAGGGASNGSRTYSGAGGGGGGAYCSAMTVVDPGAALTAEVGAGGENSFFADSGPAKRAFPGGYTRVFGPASLQGFVASGGEGGMGESSVARPPDTLIAWGGEGGKTTSCTFNSFAINRLAFSGGRGGHTSGQAGGGGGSAYRNGNGYPGQDATASDSGLGGSGFGSGGNGRTGEPGQAGGTPGGGGGASAPAQFIYSGGRGANGRVIYWFAPGYRVGGAVDPGFWANGLILRLNGSENLSVPPPQSESDIRYYNFWTPLAVGSSYAVSVAAQPRGQTCAINNAVGTIGGNVVNAAVACADDPYYVSGTVFGLTQPGLILKVNYESLAVPANANSFQFANPLRLDHTYTVSIATQPLGQTCRLTRNTFVITGNIDDVGVTCVPGKTVGGTINGQLGADSPLILKLGSSTLEFYSGSSSQFTMPGTLLPGEPYNLLVQQQPVGITCRVTNGSGTMPNADVTDVSVNCTPISSCENLDVDGDGQLLPADGLIFLRAALGFDGQRVLEGISFASGARNTWPTIRYYLNVVCGLPTSD